MVNKTLYKCIIIRYHYVGSIDRSDYHTEDWNSYDDTYLFRALEKFWNAEDFYNSPYTYRKEHREDFEIFEVKYFDSVEKAKAWKRNWWDKEQPYLEETIA